MFAAWNARLPAIRDARALRELAAWFRRHANDIENRARILERDTLRGIELVAWRHRRARALAALPDHELPPDLRRQRRAKRLEARNAMIVRDAARGWTNARLAARYRLHPSTLSRIIQRSLKPEPTCAPPLPSSPPRSSPP